MSQLNAAAAFAVLELQQLVAEFCHELDDTHGIHSHRFYTEDGVIDIGKMSFKGQAEILAFYEHLQEVQREHHPEGHRTTRHLFSNLRVSLEGDGEAAVDFIMTEYSGAGLPPLFDATLPTIVSDARFLCRREANGVWRIAEFTGQPMFAGNDPVLRQVLTG